MKITTIINQCCWLLGFILVPVILTLALFGALVLFGMLASTCRGQVPELPTSATSLAFDEAEPPPWYPGTMAQWTNLPVGIQALWDAHELPRTNSTPSLSWSCEYYDATIGSNRTLTTSKLIRWTPPTNCYCQYLRTSPDVRVPLFSWGVTMLPPTAYEYPMWGAGDTNFPQGWFCVQYVPGNPTNAPATNAQPVMLQTPLTIR